jgi:hypothetical protein
LGLDAVEPEEEGVALPEALVAGSASDEPLVAVLRLVHHDGEPVEGAPE